MPRRRLGCGQTVANLWTASVAIRRIDKKQRTYTVATYIRLGKEHEKIGEQSAPVTVANSRAAKRTFPYWKTVVAKAQTPKKENEKKRKKRKTEKKQAAMTRSRNDISTFEGHWPLNVSVFSGKTSVINEKQCEVMTPFP